MDEVIQKYAKDYAIILDGKVVRFSNDYSKMIRAYDGSVGAKVIEVTTHVDEKLYMTASLVVVFKNGAVSSPRHFNNMQQLIRYLRAWVALSGLSVRVDGTYKGKVGVFDR